MNNGYMPAYPLTEEQIDRVERGNGYEGLTKRERFAMAAMQGIASDSEFGGTLNDAVILSVTYADALLEELERSQ